MKPFLRSDRVGGQLQKVLSDILQKDISDPRLKTAIITDIKMTRDLKLARIYFTTSGGEKKDKVLSGLKSAKGYIKRKLAKQLPLRYMPDLEFYYDESYDYGSHIDQLLKKLEKDNAKDYRTLEKE